MQGWVFYLSLSKTFHKKKSKNFYSLLKTKGETLPREISTQVFNRRFNSAINQKMIFFLADHVRFAVDTAVREEELLELPLQGLEGGPLLRLLVPALEHNLVQLLRAVGEPLHAVAVADLFQHLAVRHT